MTDQINAVLAQVRTAESSNADAATAGLQFLPGGSTTPPGCGNCRAR